MAYRAARSRRADNLSYMVLLCVTAGTAYANYVFYKMRKDGTFTPILDAIDVEKEKEHLGLAANQALREAQHDLGREITVDNQRPIAVADTRQASAAPQSQAPTAATSRSSQTEQQTHAPSSRGWSWGSLKFW